MEMSISRQADSVLSSTSDEAHVEDEENNELLRVCPKECAIDLLLLLSPNDRRFDCVSPINSSEQSSQISIPFSDVVLSEGIKNSAVGDRTLVDEEAMTFSFEFKKALSESRSEEKESREDSYLSPVATAVEGTSQHIQQTEQLAEARSSQERPITSILLSEKLRSIARSLEEFRVRTPSEEQTDSGEEPEEDEEENEGYIKKMKAKIKPRNITAITKIVDIDTDYCDTNSGLWRMLSAYDDMVLSQPGHSTFRQEEKHWLESDTVPWRIMDESRKKCLEWLEKQDKPKMSAEARGTI